MNQEICTVNLFDTFRPICASPYNIINVVAEYPATRDVVCPMVIISPCVSLES